MSLTPEGAWHKALAGDALARGTLSSVVIAGRRVLLARLDDGTLAAATAICPHQAADLTQGMLYFDAIDCPLHHYVYDLRTGENRYPRNVFSAEMAARLAPLRLFPVKEQDGWIWVGDRTHRLTRTQRQIEELRKGDACVPVRDAAGRPRAGVPVWVEQERHQFLFGCIVPDLSVLSDVERGRYQARLDELFNCVVPAHQQAPAARRVELTEPDHLAVVRRRLDELGDRPLHVHVWGSAVGMGQASGLDERAIGHRTAELYTLCFAHPAVSGIVWNGLADTDTDANARGGLLRADLAPKYAFKALQKLIHSDWHTRAAGVSDGAGLFHFRGFHGDYRVGIDLGDGVTRVETLRCAAGGSEQSPRALG